MKKLLPLLVIVALTNSCDKETTNTEPTETKKRVIYRIHNTGSNSITFKLYDNGSAYSSDTGAIYTTTVAAGEINEFDFSKFSRKVDYSTYYMDWYNPNDVSNAAFLGTDYAEKTMQEYPTATDTSTVVTFEVGHITDNNVRQTVFGMSLSPVWYDVANPNDMTYTLSRTGSFTYKKGNSTYKGFFTAKNEYHPISAKKYLRLTLQASSTGNPPPGTTITIYNGEGYSAPIGSSTMVESKSGTELRTFKRR